MRVKSPKKRSIQIVFLGNTWVDATNDKPIGNAEELIKYVNSWNIVVINEDAFTRKDEFWYNK